MTRISVLSALACAALSLAASSFPSYAALKPEDLYSAVLPSVVTLDVENGAGRHFIGSAFLAITNGLAVTAWHVVHDARRVEACYSDHQRVNVLGLVDKNEALDLALIRLGGTPRPRIPLASATPRIGSRIYVMGSPRGFDFSISEGLVGQIRTLDGVRYYQLSCPISPGDSGGPALNDRGEAVGVVSWRKADAENVGFAVPSAALAAMNAARPPVAWPPNGARPLARAKQSEPLLRADMTAPDPDPADDFRALQQYLSQLAGRRVSVIVQARGSERRFNVQVPPEAAK